MPTLNGTAVNFGFVTAAGITITGLSGILLQSLEATKRADMEAARNGTGDEVTHGWYNFHDELNLEYIVSGTSIANAITNTRLQLPGAILNITGCDSVTELVGSNWEVQDGVKGAGGNTNFKRITLPIKRFPFITAVIT